LHPKCAKTDLRASVISKNFPGLYPRTPLNRGRGGEEGRVGRENGKGREEGEGRGENGRGGKGEGKGGREKRGVEGKGREEEGRGGERGRDGECVPHFLKRGYASFVIPSSIFAAIPTRSCNFL
jgi:hypothetical protein